MIFVIITVLKSCPVNYSKPGEISSFVVTETGFLCCILCARQVAFTIIYITFPVIAYQLHAIIVHLIHLVIVIQIYLDLFISLLGTEYAADKLPVKNVRIAVKMMPFFFSGCAGYFY